MNIIEIGNYDQFYVQYISKKELHDIEKSQINCNLEN